MATDAITYDIIAKDRASKVLKDVGTQGEKTSSRLQSGFSMVGKFAGIAAAGVGALGAAGAVMGIKTAASLEQAQIGFTTMLGSATKAGAYVKDLQKFAANTPFEFQGLVDSSRLLLGVGVASQKVIPMLTDFGDAAGALGIQQDAFQRIMLASSQAISAGRFQVGDINQIVQNGIPVWSLLSKSLGKPVTELRKMASTGKLTADVVLPALQRQMHKDYGGSMAKQSQTLAGLWSTFTDTLSQGLAQAMLPLVPMLKSVLPGAMNFMGAALGGLAKGLAFVIHALSGVASAVKIFFAGFTNNVGSLIDMQVQFTNPFVNAGFAVRKAFDRILPGIKAVAGWVKSDLGPALQHLGQQVFPALKSAVKSVTETLMKHKDIFVFVGNYLTRVLIPIVGQVAKAFFTVLGPAVKIAAFMISTIMIPAIRGFIGATLTLIGIMVNAAARAFGWIPGIGPKLKKAASDFNKFRDDVNRALSGIKDQSVSLKVVASINGSKTMTNQQKSKTLDRIGFAGGTSNAPAGWAWTGEEGPELVKFRGGEKVKTAGQSAQMTSGGSDFSTSTPLVINLEGRAVYQGLLTYARKSGKTSLALT